MSPKKVSVLLFTILAKPASCEAVEIIKFVSVELSLYQESSIVPSQTLFSEAADTLVKLIPDNIIIKTNKFINTFLNVSPPHIKMY